MERITPTYAYFRQLEEERGPLVRVGERLVYTGTSRFPWLCPPFDSPPGLVADVLAIDYDEASNCDYDPWDNHYYAFLSHFEEHGEICSTEIAAFFAVMGDAARLDAIAQGALLQVCKQGLRQTHLGGMPESAGAHRQGGEDWHYETIPSILPTRFLRA